MVDREKLMHQCIRHVCAERPDVAVGMAWVLERVLAVSPEGMWDAARAADWVGERDRFRAWFASVLACCEPETPLEALWFETPNDLNPAATMVNGFERLGAKDESYGLDDGACWPFDDERPDIEILDLPVLEAVIAASGYRVEDGQRKEAFLPGVYALSGSLVAMLAIDAVERSLGEGGHFAPGVALLTGFASGDVIPLAQRTKRGWGKVRGRRAERSREKWEEIAWFPDMDIAGYLAAGCDPNLRNKYGETLIMWQLTWMSPEEVDLLVGAGADLGARDPYGRTVLHEASGAPPESVRRLIELGADPNAVANGGLSVLFELAWRSEEIVEILLEHGADATVGRTAPDGQSWSVVDYACQYPVSPGHMQRLLDAGSVFQRAVSGGRTPIHCAAAIGVLQSSYLKEVSEIVPFYQGLGFDIDAIDDGGECALWVAVKKHAVELEENTRPSEVGGRWDYDHDKIAIVLLENGADPNARYMGEERRFVSKGSTPLMVRRYDDQVLVKALLRLGADPTLRDDAGRTALDHARAAMDDGVVNGRKGCAGVIKLLEAAERKWARRG